MTEKKRFVNNTLTVFFFFWLNVREIGYRPCSLLSSAMVIVMIIMIDDNNDENEIDNGDNYDNMTDNNLLL